MCCLFSLIFLTLLFWKQTLAASRFTTPTGSDGSNTYRVGDVVTISWGPIPSYPIFSLGIKSTSNQTRSWLISNSESYPRSFNWTVDPAALGFNLQGSRVFSFYACNGSYQDRSAFTLPFESVLFNVDTSTPVPTSSASATATSPATVVASSSIVTTTSSSNTLTTGTKAGIGIGSALAAVIIISAIVWPIVWCRIARRRRVDHDMNLEGQSRGYFVGRSIEIAGSPLAEHAGAEKPKIHPQQIHEVSSCNATRVQLPGDERHIKADRIVRKPVPSRPVELAS